MYITMMENNQGWAARISTWLVLGNGGALVLLFGAFIGGESHCDLSALVPSVQAFAVGLALSFSGSAIAFLIGLYTTKRMGGIGEGLARVEAHEHSLDQLERQHEPRPEDSPLNQAIDNALASLTPAVDALNRFTKWMRLPIALFILSIVAFGTGLALPLTNPSLLASCAR